MASAETTSGVARVAVGAELVKRDLLGGGEPFNGAQERWVLIYPGCQPGKLILGVKVPEANRVAIRLWHFFGRVQPSGSVMFSSRISQPDSRSNWMFTAS